MTVEEVQKILVGLGKPNQDFPNREIWNHIRECGERLSDFTWPLVDLPEFLAVPEPVVYYMNLQHMDIHELQVVNMNTLRGQFIEFYMPSRDDSLFILPKSQRLFLVSHLKEIFRLSLEVNLA